MPSLLLTLLLGSTLGQPACPFAHIPSLARSEGTYRWLIELPVAAISLDFCGVPGELLLFLLFLLVASERCPVRQGARCRRRLPGLLRRAW